jgi:hypothetical protein
MLEKRCCYADSSLSAGREAAAELARLAKECHRLALKTGDQGLITEAEASLAMVTGFGN